MIVGPAVDIDRLGRDYMSCGYGKSVCFPHMYPVNIMLCSGPVIISVFMNFVCLVQFVYQISRVTIEIRHVRRSSHYNDAQVYLRIVDLSGIFWSTGILTSVSESDLLDYIFTLLCGLQGFCITLANMTTARVQCGRTADQSGDQRCNTNALSQSKYSSVMDVAVS